MSLSGFRPDGAGLLSSVRCSGSLLRKEEDWLVILTAGHCVAAYLDGLQSGALRQVGVSFDAQIKRPDPLSSVWPPTQYLLGGSSVLPKEHGPHGLNAFNLQFDYGVIVFRRGNAWLTAGGAAVTIPAPVILAPPASSRPSSTASSRRPPYRRRLRHRRSAQQAGRGRQQGRAVNDPSKLGVRWQTSQTSAFSYMGKNSKLLLASQNPARGNEGACGGDSGGPLFHGSPERQIGITSSGDAICRATSIIARTDAPEAAAILRCVQMAEAPRRWRRAAARK